ncbi:YSIRK-type signal peptide-containing protein [Collinsella sp. AGMB00827]|uniref:YSIRK-type signal peptide-containing protein n=1 Tax=Collinsella ureilytica TaxID=2869515 RepID=A0ABS7MKZ0_9ACTN|nr:Rib/alpha-like domain-containing protein [Collinsella urealyticum]MBY4798029.1 YSIRK-type signal peptide-containing protein [Collinsella urealyticum]
MAHQTNCNDRMRAVIAAKRAACSQKKPRYGLRKLSVGLVSCMIGLLCFFSGPVAMPAAAATTDAQNAPAEVPLANEEGGGYTSDQTDDQNLTDRDATSSKPQAASLEAAPIPTPSAVQAEKPAVAPRVATREAGEYNTLDKETGAINADAFANGYVSRPVDLTNAKNTLSGKVVYVAGGTASTRDPVSTSDPGVPDGTQVFMQWQDTDGWVSPAFRAVTHTFGENDAGYYAFQVPTQTDIFGKKREWVAQSGTKYRVWSEPMARTFSPALPSDTGNALVPLSNGGAKADKWTPVATASGAFQLIGTNVQKVLISLEELPIGIDGLQDGSGNYLKATGNKLIEDDREPNKTPALGSLSGPQKAISGKVYYEIGEHLPDETGTTTINSDYDPGAPGMKVFMTVLTREGKAAIKNIMDHGSDIDRVMWSKEVKDTLSQHPEYIEATYWTTTDQEGKYTVAATQPGTAFDRTFLYMWVENPQTGQILPTYSPFILPGFFAYNANNNWGPSPIGAPAAGDTAYNVNFGLRLGDFANLDVTNYDTTKHIATPGDTANIKVSGNLKQLNTEIRIMKDGEQIGKSIPVNPADLINAFSWDVPENAKEGIYTAVLSVAGQDLAQDSFAVARDDDGDGDVNATDPDDGNKGTPDDPNKVVEADATQRITHGVSLIGKGATADDAQVVKSDGDGKTHKELIVDANGTSVDEGTEGAEDLSNLVVTLTGKDGKPIASGTADTWRGTENYPLVQNFGLHNFEQGEYKVNISLGDGVKHWAVTKSSQLKDGATINVDGNLANQSVTLGYDSNGNGIADVDEDNAGQYEPNPVPTTTVKYGEGATTPAITLDDTFTDEKEEIAPNKDKKNDLYGTEFSIPTEGNTAGATIDKTTGEITLPKNAEPGTYTYKVTVKYPDDSKDTVDVKVVVGPKITDELNAEGGKIVVPESISDEDLTKALKDAVQITGKDGQEVKHDDQRITSIAPKGALPEKKGTQDVEMTVTYSDGSTDTATVNTTFVGDVVPVPDPKNPPAVPDNYVQVTFAAGDHGKIHEGETTVFKVNPKVEVDLTKNAPKIDANEGWTQNGWDSALKDTFTGNKTITATYTQNPKITDELNAEGGKIVVPESISDEDLTKALKDAVQITGKDGQEVKHDDQRITSIAPKGALPEKKGTQDVEMTVTYSDGSTDTATVNTTFVGDVVPVPDPKNPPAVPDNYVQVTFAAGDHGKIHEGETTVFKVNPKVEVDLTKNAPKIDANEGWTQNGWDSALKDTFTGNKTITATYTQNPKTPESPKDADIYDPKGQDITTEIGVTPDPSEGIKNKGDLPKDTKYTWKEQPRVNEEGDTPATIVVTYPDGSADEVKIVIHVIKPQEPAVTPQTEVKTPKKKAPEQKAQPKRKAAALPQTGDISTVAGAAVASAGVVSLLGATAACRKRREKDC